MSARFNLELSDELDSQINAIAADAEAKATLICKALALYLAATKANRDEGLEVGFFDSKTKQLKREVVGMWTG